MVGSGAGLLEAVESRKRQKDKVQTCAQSEAHRGLGQPHGVFPEAPVCLSEHQTWLGERILFPSKGGPVTVDRTKHHRPGSRTMLFELMESHEKAACFCW